MKVEISDRLLERIKETLVAHGYDLPEAYGKIDWTAIVECLLEEKLKEDFGE